MMESEPVEIPEAIKQLAEQAQARGVKITTRGLKRYFGNAKWRRHQGDRECIRRLKREAKNGKL